MTCVLEHIKIDLSGSAQVTTSRSQPDTYCQQAESSNQSFSAASTDMPYITTQNSLCMLPMQIAYPAYDATHSYLHNLIPYQPSPYYNTGDSNAFTFQPPGAPQVQSAMYQNTHPQNGFTSPPIDTELSNSQQFPNSGDRKRRKHCTGGWSRG